MSDTPSAERVVGVGKGTGQRRERTAHWGWGSISMLGEPKEKPIFFFFFKSVIEFYKYYISNTPLSLLVKLSRVLVNQAGYV